MAKRKGTIVRWGVWTTYQSLVADSLAQVLRIQLAGAAPADYNRGKFKSF